MVDLKLVEGSPDGKIYGVDIEHRVVKRRLLEIRVELGSGLTQSVTVRIDRPPVWRHLEVFTHANARKDGRYRSSGSGRANYRREVIWMLHQAQVLNLGNMGELYGDWATDRGLKVDPALGFTWVNCLGSIGEALIASHIYAVADEGEGLRYLTPRDSKLSAESTQQAVEAVRGVSRQWSAEGFLFDRQEAAREGLALLRDLESALGKVQAMVKPAEAVRGQGWLI